MDQSSLEGIIHFSTEQPLGASERTRARDTFYRIIEHVETANAGRGGSSKGDEYNRALLVRLTYEHARSENPRIFTYGRFSRQWRFRLTVKSISTRTKQATGNVSARL